MKQRIIKIVNSTNVGIVKKKEINGNEREWKNMILRRYELYATKH